MSGGTFVQNGNASIEPSGIDIETRNVDWFAKELLRIGVCATEIAWGDYKTHFKEVPVDFMDSYLHHRKKEFHADALRLVLQEAEAASQHPWSLGS